MKKLLLAGAVAGVLGLTGQALAATTATVDPGNMGAWAFQTSLTATAAMESGPATPPLGTGSAGLNVGSDGNGAAQLRNTGYAGTALADLTALSYSTYVDVDGSGGQAPYIILQLDVDGNGSVDDLLFFEPVYQTATFFPSNPQAPLALDAWQTWDALNGGWWSLNGVAGAGPGTNVKSISHYLTVEPNATIVNSGSGLGGVRIVTGFGGGTWDNFEGNVDAFTINDTTYNFEASPSSMDSCKGTGWSAFTSPRVFKNQGDCVKFTQTGK